MRERSTAPEDLPGLELKVMRHLDLDRGPAQGSPARVCAASGLVRRGGFAYVIGDDLLDLAVFDLAGSAPGTLRPALRRGGGEGTGDKPDLEALTAVPPFEACPFGGLLGLGSGSKESRDRGFFWRLDANGALEGEPRQVDFAPLYGLLRSELGEINVEGVCVVGETLWIFNRGNSEKSPNAVASVALPDLGETLGGDREVGVEELAGLAVYELGDFDGVGLCFSDATQLSDELVAFTASAENEDAADGRSIRGSVVGTIDGDGDVRRLRAIDRKWKVEGIDATLGSGILDLAFVCDQDDEDAPSPLLSATMPLEARFEESGSGSAPGDG
jgi:hypothetical protein